MWIILRFWETAHLPLAEASINTYLFLPTSYLGRNVSLVEG